MANPYVGEIRMVGFNFAPKGWALCNGQLLSINQNTALFSILGVTFGGNGTSDFGLPNLMAQAPLGYGNGAGLTPRTWGETGGEYKVTLLQSQLAQHTHPISCISGQGSSNSPSNAVWASAEGGRVPPPLYASALPGRVNMNPAAVGIAGGNLPHNNLPPFLAINIIIALQGVYPQRP